MTRKQKTCPYCESHNWNWVPSNADGDMHIECQACGRAIGWECKACGDPWPGVVFEDDYACDWINFGHDVIFCPECDAEGIEWLTPHAAKQMLESESD